MFTNMYITLAGIEPEGSCAITFSYICVCEKNPAVNIPTIALNSTNINNDNESVGKNLYIHK